MPTVMTTTDDNVHRENSNKWPIRFTPQQIRAFNGNEEKKIDEKKKKNKRQKKKKVCRENKHFSSLCALNRLTPEINRRKTNKHVNIVYSNAETKKK